MESEVNPTLPPSLPRRPEKRPLEEEEVRGAVWTPNWDVIATDSLFLEKDQRSVASDVFIAFLVLADDSCFEDETMSDFLSDLTIFMAKVLQIFARGVCRCQDFQERAIVQANLAEITQLEDSRIFLERDMAKGGEG